MDTQSQSQSEADKAHLARVDESRTAQLARQEKERSILKLRLAIGAVIVIGLVGLYWGLSETGMLSILGDEQTLRERIGRMGFWGPLAIVALITIAIVMSPIPSGPLAIISGAVYGPLWGTVYVVAGAELGALVAFSLTRCLGYEIVRRWTSAQLLLGRLSGSRSQAALMAIVFGSRLVPFISFDAVSYAAGLTPLTFWRFALATLAGVVPISFLLAYFGEELATAETGYGMLIVLLVGGMTMVPIGGSLMWSWYRKRRDAARMEQQSP